MYKDDINASNRREILSHIRKVEVALGSLKYGVSEKAISLTTLHKVTGHLHLAIGHIDLVCGILEGERLLGPKKRRR